MENSVKNLVIEKRLSKYSVDQLQKKLANSETPQEEIKIIESILEKRGKLTIKTVTTDSVNEVELPKKQLVKEEKKETKVVKLPSEPKVLVNVKHKSIKPEIKAEPELDVVEKKKSSGRPISDLIDDIYELNDKKLNKELCNLFPEDGVDDYEELDQEIKDSIINFHKSIFNKAQFVPAKEMKQTKPAIKISDDISKVSSKNKFRSLEMDGDNIIMIDGDLKVERPVIDGLKLKTKISFGDSISVTKKKDNSIVEGVVKSIFNGIYEKDFVFVLKTEDKKEKWIKLASISSIVKK